MERTIIWDRGQPSQTLGQPSVPDRILPTLLCRARRRSHGDESRLFGNSFHSLPDSAEFPCFDGLCSPAHLAVCPLDATPRRWTAPSVEGFPVSRRHFRGWVQMPVFPAAANRKMCIQQLHAIENSAGAAGLVRSAHSECLFSGPTFQSPNLFCPVARPMRGGG
jgi:hypothetical protein